jgi:pyrroloquinoline quinone (PQQ) biosynthesis protein C
MGVDRMDAERTARYPGWVRDVIAETEPAAERVTDHAAWRLMREGSITPPEHRNILVGFWPLIDRFPQFLAQNLLKTSYGRHPGLNAARAWLAKNLRLEQKHAEWFLDWAEALGIPRDEMLDGWRPAEMTAIADWCWRLGESGDLAEAMAATNYAIEGATGRWTPGVASSERYRATLDAAHVERGMRWLEAHADYDDAHPWQALDIISELVGPHPTRVRSRGIRDAIQRSYELYARALDAALAAASTLTGSSLGPAPQEGSAAA